MKADKLGAQIERLLFVRSTSLSYQKEEEEEEVLSVNRDCISVLITLALTSLLIGCSHSLGE